MLRRLAIALALAGCAAILAAPTAQGGAGAGWCGPMPPPMDDLPDLERSLQVHIIYAHPSDRPDQFPAIVAGIVTDIKAIDDWWQSRDPSRAPRWDFASFDGCPTQFGQLDISIVWLPNPAAFYSDPETAVQLISEDAVAAGHDDANKKYLLYYDGAVTNPQVCGKAANGNRLRDGGAGSYAIVFMGNCSMTIGTGTDIGAITAIHELAHQLGALAFPRPEPGPPNECAPPDNGHPCDSMTDLMTPVQPVGATLQNRDLDTGNDQYYNHGQSWWDIRLSLFLRHIGDGDSAAPTGPKLGSLKPRLMANNKDVVLSFGKARDQSLHGYRVLLNGERLWIGSGRFSDGFKMVKYKESTEFKTTGPKNRTIPVFSTLVDEAGKKKRLFKRGKVILITVQAIDDWGLLGPPVTLRYKVGFGVLGKKGNKVKRDTDGPKRPKLLGASATTAATTFRFRKTTDTVSNVVKYFIYRNKKRFRTINAADLPSGRVMSVTIPGFKRGTYVIVAVDKAGNQSQPSNGIIF